MKTDWKPFQDFDSTVRLEFQKKQNRHSWNQPAQWKSLSQ